MKITQSFLISAFILLSQASVASDNNDKKTGEQLYQTHCSSCHGLTGGMDFSKRVAPPIIAVRLHYIAPYPDEEEFITAVADWVAKQDESKSLMRGAIRKFKIMPPISIARDDAKKVAAYIYKGDIEKPAGFDKHVEEQHGRHGQKHDME